MSKRQRFVITSGVLSLGFVGIQFLDNQYRFWAIAGLGAATLILFAWSLLEGLGKNMTLLTLILPTLYTLGVGVFWFLLPASIFARFPVVILYGVGIYVLCLTMNIYTVAAIRTIALLRAARGVGFVLTLLTSFLIYDAILSFRAMLPITVASVIVFSFPILLQGFWAIPLEKEFDKELLILSGASALIIGEIALFLFFWPATVVVGSLFLTATIYMLLGLGQAKLEGRLFPQTVRDYLLVGVFVFIGMFFATRWGS